MNRTNVRVKYFVYLDTWPSLRQSVLIKWSPLWKECAHRWSAVSVLALCVSEVSRAVQHSLGESWQRQSALCAEAPLPRWPETGQDRQGTAFPLGQKCSVDSPLITAHLVIWSCFMKALQTHTRARKCAWIHTFRTIRSLTNKGRLVLVLLNKSLHKYEINRGFNCLTSFYYIVLSLMHFLHK